MKLRPKKGTVRLAFCTMALLCSGLVLAGCTTSSGATTHSDPATPTPTPTASPVFSDPRDRIGESCAVLAMVQTELENAFMQHAKGTRSRTLNSLRL
jgi:hypothetical protein